MSRLGIRSHGASPRGLVACTAASPPLDHCLRHYASDRYFLNHETVENRALARVVWKSAKLVASARVCPSLGGLTVGVAAGGFTFTGCDLRTQPNEMASACCTNTVTVERRGNRIASQRLLGPPARAGWRTTSPSSSHARPVCWRRIAPRGGDRVAAWFFGLVGHLLRHASAIVTVRIMASATVPVDASRNPRPPHGWSGHRAKPRAPLDRGLTPRPEGPPAQH